MTDEDVRDYLTILGCSNHRTTELEKVITALEQENMFRKIRKEIEVLPNVNPPYTHTCDMVDRGSVLNIIDKYRGGGVG